MNRGAGTAVAACAGLLGALWFSRLLPLLLAWMKIGAAIFPNPASFTATAAVTRLGTLLLLLACSFVFWSNGRPLARALGLPADSRMESAAVSLALGALLWGQLFFLLGLAGLLRLALLRALLAVGFALGLAECVRCPPNLPALRREFDDAGWYWLAALAAVLLLLAPYAFIPETFFDALEYHLGLPQLYLLRGRIGPVPDNAFSGVPSVPSMLYGLTLALDGTGRLAHLLNFAFLPATCLCLLGVARRLGSMRAGGLAALLFALTPCVCAAAHRVGVELAGAFFQTAALSILLGAASSAAPGPWIGAGLLIGAAMSTKYLAWGLPLAALAAAWVVRERFPSRGAAWAASACLAVLAPWLVKNAVFYGNPVYPFLHEFWRPQAEVMPGWRYVSAGASIPWDSGPAAAFAAWLRAPLGALRYQRDFPQFASPVLFGLLPAGLWLCARRRPYAPLLWFAAAAWLPVSLVTDMPRYFIPLYPLLALFAAIAAEAGGKPLLALTAASLAGLAAAVSLGGLPHTHLPVFTGQRSETAFLEHSNEAYYPGPLYPAARWLDEHAPKDARVLIFGDARGFQLTRDHLLSTPMQASVLERWANASADEAALRARFERERVSYIVVNHAEIFRQQLTLRFSPAGKRALDRFWARDTRRVFQIGPEEEVYSSGQKVLDRWVAVYELLSPDEAAKPHQADDLFAAYNVAFRQ